MINLMTKPMMRTAKSFQYPLGCLEDDCTYKVTWTQIDNDIEVTVSGIVQDESDWIGVGFLRSFLDERGCTASASAVPRLVTKGPPLDARR